jgi:hypothetical protein
VEGAPKLARFAALEVGATRVDASRERILALFERDNEGPDKGERGTS